MDEFALFVVGNDDRTIGDFSEVEVVFVEHLDILFEHAARIEGLKKRSAKVWSDACLAVDFNFLFELTRHKSSSKAELDDVCKVRRGFNEMLCFAKT